MSVNPVPRPAGPDLCSLLQRPEQITEIPAEIIPHLLAHLSSVQIALVARLLSAQANRDSSQEGTDSDQLLRVQEAAERLRTSPDYLYRNAKRLPFTVRLGPRQLRFSAHGIDRYIRQRAGR